MNEDILELKKIKNNETLENVDISSTLQGKLDLF